MKSTLHAKGTEIAIVSRGKDDDFISMTDIAKYKNPEFPADVVKNWLRTRSTIEFLGIWEEINNPSFKLVEFDQFRNEAGSNAFVLNPHCIFHSNDSVVNLMVSQNAIHSKGSVKAFAELRAK